MKSDMVTCRMTNCSPENFMVQNAMTSHRQDALYASRVAKLRLWHVLPNLREQLRSKTESTHLNGFASWSPLVQHRQEGLRLAGLDEKRLRLWQRIWSLEVSRAVHLCKRLLAHVDQGVAPTEHVCSFKGPCCFLKCLHTLE